MRSRWVDPRRAALLALCAAGCALSLDGDEPPGPAEPDGGAPALAACKPSPGASGRIGSYAAGGTTHLVVDRLGDLAPALLDVPATGAGECLAAAFATAARPALDARALGDGVAARVLTAFVAGGRRLAYVEASRGLEPLGVALAEQHQPGGRFVVAAEYLFTADRARFGDAVLVDGDTVYAYGCREIAFFTDGCFVARVPAARAGDRTAYEYYRAGGAFGPELDDAWSIFDGGRGLAVAAHGGRVVAVYARPLARTLELRVGLGPSGPWSAPVEVARCDLPDGEAFCGAVALHPALDADPGALVATYGVASFAPLSDAATRLVRLPVDGR